MHPRTKVLSGFGSTSEEIIPDRATYDIEYHLDPYFNARESAYRQLPEVENENTLGGYINSIISFYTPNNNGITMVDKVWYSDSHHYTPGLMNIMFVPMPPHSTDTKRMYHTMQWYDDPYFRHMVKLIVKVYIPEGQGGQIRTGDDGVDYAISLQTLEALNALDRGACPPITELLQRYKF